MIQDKMLVYQQHPFNGPLFRTIQMSQYQKNEANLDLLKQEVVSGSGISWIIMHLAADR